MPREHKTVHPGLEVLTAAAGRAVSGTAACARATAAGRHMAQHAQIGLGTGYETGHGPFGGALAFGTIPKLLGFGQRTHQFESAITFGALIFIYRH